MKDKYGNNIKKGDYIYVINSDLFKDLTRKEYNKSYKVVNINYVSVSDSKEPIGFIELEENCPFFGYMITNKDVEKDNNNHNEDIIDTEICDTFNFKYKKQLEDKNNLELALEEFKNININFKINCNEANFNEEQLDIINTWNKNLLNIAGPGSGKTTTLTKKIEYYLKNDGSIENIMVLTFTKAAANEILKRNSKYIKDINNIYFGTFHSIFYKLLTKNNILDNVILYQPNEIENLFVNRLLQNIENFFPEELLNSILEDYYSTKIRVPKVLQLNKTIIKNRIFNIPNLISLIHNKVLNLTQDEVINFSSLKDLIDDIYKEIIFEIEKNIENKNLYNTYIRDNFKTINFNVMNKVLSKTFIDFITDKIENNIIDYNDILLYTLFVLNNNINLKVSIQKYFKYIFVDEYQDTNVITKEILKTIHNSLYNNMIVIGDPYQSIYKFMGATIDNIKNSINDFKTEVKQLTYNYRSNENIVKLTNQVLSNMIEKLPFDLKPLKVGNKNLKNNKIYYQTNVDNKEVMSYIIDYIKENLDKKIAILHRKGYVPDIENSLVNSQIEYNKLGGIKLNQSLEIKSLMYFINYFYSKDNKHSLEELLKSCYKNIKNIETSNDYLLKQLKELKKEKTNIKKLIDFYNKNIFVIYAKRWDFERLKNAKIKIEDLQKDLLKSSEEDILVILNNFLISAEQKKFNPNCNITLSTIHSAKGLEWDTVFILGLSSEEFKEDVDTNDKDKAENQRLVYVAISRAKTELFLFSEENNIYNIDIDDNFMTNILPNDKNNIEGFIFTFGKYKNKNVNDINDYNYLEWILSKREQLIKQNLLSKKHIKYIQENIIGF